MALQVARHPPPSAGNGARYDTTITGTSSNTTSGGGKAGGPNHDTQRLAVVVCRGTGEDGISSTRLRPRTAVSACTMSSRLAKSSTLTRSDSPHLRRTGASAGSSGSALSRTTTQSKKEDAGDAGSPEVEKFLQLVCSIAAERRPKIKSYARISDLGKLVVFSKLVCARLWEKKKRKAYFADGVKVCTFTTVSRLNIRLDLVQSSCVRSYVQSWCAAVVKAKAWEHSDAVLAG